MNAKKIIDNVYDGFVKKIKAKGDQDWNFNYSIQQMCGCILYSIWYSGKWEFFYLTANYTLNIFQTDLDFLYYLMSW